MAPHADSFADEMLRTGGTHHGIIGDGATITKNYAKREPGVDQRKYADFYDTVYMEAAQAVDARTAADKNQSAPLEPQELISPPDEHDGQFKIATELVKK
jgi:hypothetical protein